MSPPLPSGLDWVGSPCPDPGTRRVRDEVGHVNDEGGKSRSLQNDTGGIREG